MAKLPNVKWKKGVPESYYEGKGIDANLCYKELVDIGANHSCEYNKIPNGEIVDWAKNHPESELYKVFEWDDSKAADQQRRSAANRLKNHFVLVNPPVIKKATASQVNLSVPAFINPHHEKLKTHAPAEIVLKDKDLRASMLRKALEELKSFQNKYHMFSELDNVFKAIDKLNIP